MKPRHLLTMLLVALLTVGSLRAADDLLTMVPDNALAVVVLNHLATLDGKVQKLGQQLQAPVPPLLPMAKAQMNVQNGLDEQGNLAVILLPGGGETQEPVPFVLIPVTDYKAFVEQLHPKDASAKIAEVQAGNQTALVAEKNHYAVFAQAERKAELEALLSASANVTAAVEPLQGWLKDQDVYVVVMHSGLERMIEKGGKALDNLRQAAAAAPQSWASMSAGIDVYAAALKAAGKELTHLALGIRIDDDGNVHIAKRGLFNPNGEWAGRADSIQPLAGGALFGLPNENYVVAFGGPVPRGLADTVARLTAANPAMANVPAEQSKKLQEFSAQMMRDAQGIAFVLGIGSQSDSLYANSASIIRVADATAYLDKYQKTLDAMRQAFDQIKVKFEAQPLAVDDLKGLQITMDMSGMIDDILSKPGMANPMSKIMLQRFFGPDSKLTTYIAAVGDKALVTAYSKDALKRAAENIRSKNPGFKADSDVTKTAKLLPSESQWTGYINPKGAVMWFQNMVLSFQAAMAQQNPGAVMPPLNLPVFAETTPIGLGIKVNRQNFEAELVLPNDVLMAVAQFARSVAAMRAGQAAGQGANGQ